MRLNRMAKALLVLAVSSCCLAGCSNEKKEADFSEINSVCELATLKCYYHNVAKAETEASGLFKWLGKGYKKIWTEYSGIVELGKGPVLCNSPIVVKKLNQKMEECAKKLQISVQREAAGRLTCTDGDKIHFSNEGVPVVLVSIPLRYMHTHAEVADRKDVEGCIELIAEFLAEME